MSARRAFLATVAVYLGAVVAAAVVLPRRVPLHFGPSGEADRWADRGAAVATLTVVGLGVALLLLLAGVLVARSSVTHLNVPHKAWWTSTPERERELRSRLRTDVDVLGVATMVLLVAIVGLTVRAARLAEPRLDAWTWVAVGGYLAFVLTWAVWTLRVRYRPLP